MAPQRDLACISPIIEAEYHPPPLCLCEMPVHTQLGYGAKDEPELLILLPSHAKYWDYIRLPPHLDWTGARDRPHSSVNAGQAGTLLM